MLVESRFFEDGNRTSISSLELRQLKPSGGDWLSGWLFVLLKMPRLGSVGASAAEILGQHSCKYLPSSRFIKPVMVTILKNIPKSSLEKRYSRRIVV